MNNNFPNEEAITTVKSLSSGRKDGKNFSSSYLSSPSLLLLTGLSDVLSLFFVCFLVVVVVHLMFLCWGQLVSSRVQGELQSLFQKAMMENLKWALIWAQVPSWLFFFFFFLLNDLLVCQYYGFFSCLLISDNYFTSSFTCIIIIIIMLLVLRIIFFQSFL